MRLSDSRNQEGSVLLTAFLTISILTLICATSLYVTSQNQTSGMQTASWQQALAGAESGVDMGVRALNTGTWTGWSTQQYGSSLPSTMPPFTLSSPSPAPAASAAGTPASGYCNYLVFGSQASPQIALGGVSGSTNPPEGNRSIWGWVTVDNAGLTPDSNGQWYRIRATGVAGTNGLFRTSNNRLDNDLRNTIALRFDRKQSGTISNPQATRTIEVVMQPLSSGGWPRGITMRNQIIVSGGYVDSFDSSNPFKSTNGLYDVTKRQSHADIATNNSAGLSDLKGKPVYGNLSYSGSPVQNTSGVKGTISTPFSATIPDAHDPSWASGSYTSYTASSLPTTLPLTTGTKNNPQLVKITGDVNLTSGKSIVITSVNSGTDNNYITIWITGYLAVKSGAIISQDANAHVTFYVDSDITTAAGGLSNSSGRAANLNIIGVGTGNTVTVSGSGVFVGTVNAPGDNIVVSGSGDWSGAVIGNTFVNSGGANFHFDEALKSGSGSSFQNYAFASWFEDNSDPNHKDVNGNTIIY